MYRQKTIKIRRVCKAIMEKYKGRVPDNREELLTLYGVGFKTADIVLSYGFGIPTIAVDTHVSRIPKRIGIVDEKANVEEVRNELERLTPKKQRYIVNVGFVRFGQTLCRPVGPKCPQCELKKICSYYKNIYIPKERV
jgi:endonuclease-3